MATIGEGVSVKQVLALAPHVTLTPPSTPPATAPAGGGVWAENKIDAKPTEEMVAGYIGDVTRAVDIRLLRLALITNETMAGRIAAAANSVIAVGAAATLISAVYPTKAGINDQASYSAELWNRYNTDLDNLVAALEQAVKDQSNPSTGGKAFEIRGTFRESTITDEIVW